MALSSILAELAAAVLALDTVVSLLFHLSELRLLLVGEASPAHSAVALLGSPRSRTHSLSELQGLQFPLGDLARGQLLLLFFLSLLRFLIYLCSLFLGIWIVLKAFSICVGSLSLFGRVERLSFFNEDFLANLLVLHHRLVIELAPTVMAGNQHACITIFVRLFVLLVV